jgi:superfamily II DNA helicase RecQ
LNDRRWDQLWTKKKFTDKIICVTMDEDHVIKEWDGTFRSDYLKLGPLRYLWPRVIPIILGSATVGPQMVPDLSKNLRSNKTFITRLNTDRPNIFLVVEHMKHPTNSYKDLAFLIKKGMTVDDPKPIKFLVFFNSRTEAQAGSEYLGAHLSPELRDKVNWFHSGMTDEFRESEIHTLLIGDIFGDGATDAAGMVSILL